LINQTIFQARFCNPINSIPAIFNHLSQQLYPSNCQSISGAWNQAQAIPSSGFMNSGRSNSSSGFGNQEDQIPNKERSADYFTSLGETFIPIRLMFRYVTLPN